MSEITRELVELKREIIEARNQAIKTDNQVVNLSLDVRGFEKRFDALEKRARLASLGVNVVVAVTVLVAAQGVATMRAKNDEKTIHDLREQVGQLEAAGEATQADLKTRLAEFERLRDQQVQAGQVATDILNKVDAHDDAGAAAALEQLQPGQLSPLERRLFDARVAELRRRSAEAAFRVARSFIGTDKADRAVVELRRVLAFDPEASFVPQARQQLGVTLWAMHRWDEAETVFRRLLDGAGLDPETAEEARYLLASALAHQGRREGAKGIFDELVAAGGKYERQSKAYLVALQAGAELPDGAAAAADPQEAQRRSDEPANRPAERRTVVAR